MYKIFSNIGVHIWNDIQKHINVSVYYGALAILAAKHINKYAVLLELICWVPIWLLYIVVHCT